MERSYRLAVKRALIPEERNGQFRRGSVWEVMATIQDQNRWLGVARVFCREAQSTGEGVRKKFCQHDASSPITNGHNPMASFGPTDANSSGVQHQTHVSQLRSFQKFRNALRSSIRRAYLVLRYIGDHSLILKPKPRPGLARQLLMAAGKYTGGFGTSGRSP